MSSKAFQRWQAASATSTADPQELERLREAAREAGFAAGLEQGLAAGRERVEAQQAADGERLAALLESLAAPLVNLEQELLDSLQTLALALARQVVRGELTAVPARIADLVRAGVAALPATARQITVHLHPEDVDLVRSLARRGRNDARWELLADAGVQRGGCRISTEASEVDLTLDTRLREAYDRLLEVGGA
ncbi:FliH/SctL family protein [Immundisolibacter sp.]|uniref:FliH/SctL family protein n=1 Tax=Immundisolibacter sp. TaxID=1934948 RepID=UPI003F85E0EB